MHRTLHASGTTVTFSWTSAGYDAVAFFRDGSRLSLIDEVNNRVSVWDTARWIVETSGLGSVDDLGEVLVGLLFDPKFKEAEAEQPGAIVGLVEQLGRMRQ